MDNNLPMFDSQKEKKKKSYHCPEFFKNLDSMWELAKQFKDTNQGESLGFGSAIPVYMFSTNIWCLPIAYQLLWRSGEVGDIQFFCA